MKFSMAPMKHNRATVGRIKGHNTRRHQTSSQLPKAAWFTPEGRRALIDWRGDVLDKAKALSKRKDAVLAVEIILQVGNQSDWRELPTEDQKEGKPKAGCLEIIERLDRAMLKAASNEFGAENIISVERHGDESSPHWHVVAAPIYKGKLQAKHWLNGPAMVAKLRERLHLVVNAEVPCTYEKGSGKGGALHDPGRAAGVAPVPTSGLFGKLKGAVSNTIELEAAKQKLKELEAENVRLFSRVKKAIQAGIDRKAEAQQAIARMRIASDRAKAAEDRAIKAEGKLLALMFDPDEPTPSTRAVISPRPK